MASTTWYRVAAEVALDRTGTASALVSELVADALWAHGAPAVETREVESSVVVIGGFDDRALADAAAEAAAAAGAAQVTVGEVVDDGLDAWREHARPEVAGPFVIVPRWWTGPVDATRVALSIDPGRTFGSGSHPTTRATLEVMARLVTTGSTVLDVGCGSGVLSVGAALLGAARVVGVDVDPNAPAVTVENATVNGVADRVEASTSTLAEIAAARSVFDVVAANLLAPVLVELADDLVATTRSGGSIVASGLLADRWAETVEVLVGDGRADLVEVVEVDGWVAVHLRRPVG